MSIEDICHGWLNSQLFLILHHKEIFMTVRLSFLDRLDSFSYDTVGDVALADEKYEIIGTCTLTRSESGQHFGELNVDRELDGDLFFYYTFSNTEDNWFTGIQLNKTQRKGSGTTRLKEMIVE